MRVPEEFTDRDKALGRYEEQVSQWESFILPYVEDFLARLIRLALAEYGSLVAAGMPKDGVTSYTQVMEMWKEAARTIAKANSQPGRRRAARTDYIEAVLANSALPREASAKIRAVLKQALSEQWSYRKTQIHLNKLLLPTQGEGENRIDYRERVLSFAKRIAARSHNADALNWFKKSGMSHKMWVTRKDSRVRHSHRALDSVVVEVGEMFKVGKVWMPYPGWHKGPPEETFNCRCLIIGLQLDKSKPNYTGISGDYTLKKGKKR